MVFSFWLILIITLFRINYLNSIDLSGRDYIEVPQNLSNEVQIDLSHNEIERIDEQVFGPNTQRIYLNDNRINYINPIVFRDLYNLSELDLSNNQLQSFEIDFNFVKGETKETFVNLDGNFDLTLLSK
jgi:Leucine-rich repeat (LRR) protein